MEFVLVKEYIKDGYNEIKTEIQENIYTFSMDEINISYNNKSVKITEDEIDEIEEKFIQDNIKENIKKIVNKVFYTVLIYYILKYDVYDVNINNENDIEKITIKTRNIQKNLTKYTNRHRKSSFIQILKKLISKKIDHVYTIQIINYVNDYIRSMIQQRIEKITKRIIIKSKLKLESDSYITNRQLRLENVIEKILKEITEKNVIDIMKDIIGNSNTYDVIDTIYKQKELDQTQTQEVIEELLKNRKKKLKTNNSKA
jgi:hypothetical protein